MMNEAEAQDTRQHVLILEHMSANTLRKAEATAKSMRGRAELLKQWLQREAPEGHKNITDADQQVFKAELQKRKQRYK